VTTKANKLSEAGHLVIYNLVSLRGMSYTGEEAKLLRTYYLPLEISIISPGYNTLL
jgi:hypothetical protein